MWRFASGVGSEIPAMPRRCFMLMPFSRCESRCLVRCWPVRTGRISAVSLGGGVLKGWGVVGSDRRRIGKALGRLLAGRGPSTSLGTTRLSTKPGCEFGLLVEERLREMASDLKETRALVKWLFLAALGLLLAVIGDLAVRLLS